MRTVTLVGALMLCLTLGSHAQDTKDTTPVLTEVQRLQLQVAAQNLEIARLNLEKVYASLQIKGYDLNLQTLTYVKQEPKVPK